MLTLKLSSKYSRREVHSIFSPETKFTPQAGSWGLHGILLLLSLDVGGFFPTILTSPSHGLL